MLTININGLLLHEKQQGILHTISSSTNFKLEIESEIWAMKVEDLARLEIMEQIMVKWMCGVQLKSKTASAELNSRLGIECIKVWYDKADWFGHVMKGSWWWGVWM